MLSFCYPHARKSHVNNFRGAMNKLIFAGVIIVAACTSAPSPTADRQMEERAIRQLNQQWSDATKRKDIDGILSFYAPGGTAAFPDKPAAVGTEALRKLWSEDLAIPGLLTLSWEPERIDVSTSGDFASDFGRVYSEWQTPQGVVKSTDKYLAVWKKIDGAWKVSYDTWNTNAPMK